MKKIFTFLFLSLTICLFGQVASDRKVSLRVSQEPISDVLFRLSELSDVNITFSPDFFPDNKKVNLNAEQQSLKLVLRECLEGTEISYKLENGGIILFRQKPQYYTLSGYLTDAKTGERLVGANLIELNSSRGTAGNAYGFYSQKFKRGKVKLQVSYLGYQSEIIELDLDKAQKLNVALQPSLTLEEITVVSSKDSVLINETGNMSTLPLEYMKHLPHAGGESDVLRYIQLLPGVQTGADGFGGLHIRGGNSDQNLVLLDDVPVYNPSHSFGLFSIFNPDITRSVKLYKGAFPARYDGRISSVLDVRMREGNDQKVSGEISTGTIATRGILEFPIKKDKGGVLIAGRKTHINSWLPRLSSKLKGDDRTGEMRYDFYDFNVKAHYSLGLKDKIYLSYYRGKDDFSDFTVFGELAPEEEEFPIEGDFFTFASNEYSTAWGNQIISLRWNHLFNDKLFSNTTITHSEFSYSSDNEQVGEISFGEDDFFAFQESEFYTSDIVDNSIRTDFDYFINNNNRLRFGANAVLRGFLPGFSEGEISGSSLNDFEDFDFEEEFSNEKDFLQSTEVNLYAEHEIRFKKLTLNAGLHTSAFLSEDRADIIPQPRLSLKYDLDNKMSVNLAAARTAQYIHLATKTNAGLPNDIWVPAGEDTPPQTAWQISGGTTFQPTPELRFSIDAYYKTMKNLVRIDPDAFIIETEGSDTIFFGADEIDTALESGDGEAMGIEFLVEKQKGKWTGWLSYALTKSTRTFRGVENRFTFDSRHNIRAVLNYQATSWLNFSANWFFNTGRPLRVNQDGIPFTSSEVPFVGILGEDKDLDLNSDNLPAYHRLDFGVNFHFGKKKLRHKLYLGAYNIYNRRNIFAAVLFQEDTTSIEGTPTRLSAARSLPILPSLSYAVKF